MPASLSIGFRLSDERVTAQLQERATAAGQSVHELARHLVVEALTATPPSGEGPACAVELREIRQTISALRADLSVILEALVVAGRILAPEEARRFVTEKLPR